MAESSSEKKGKYIFTNSSLETFKQTNYDKKCSIVAQWTLRFNGKYYSCLANEIQEEKNGELPRR